MFIYQSIMHVCDRKLYIKAYRDKGADGSYMAHQPGNPFPINGTGASRRNMIDCSGNRREVSTEHTKIFVGGLAWETTRESLKRHFDQFGEIWEAVVIGDKYSGRSKGYGFVSN